MNTLRSNARTVKDSSYWGDNGDWLIAIAMHRDSDCLTRSNFACFESALKALPEFKAWEGEWQPVTIERFSHWAVGWVDYLVIDPAFTPGIALAESMREKLEDYPVINDEHYSRLESDEAEEVWRNCYWPKDRIEYIREHRSEFEFHGLNDMLACIRGKYFAGCASELLH